MSKSDRREQLLLVAEDIVKNQGTDALTLITLAEQAGVSKPVTYEHFTHREGLFVALYQRYDHQVIQAIQQSMLTASSLDLAAQAVATAYLHCAFNYGQQYEAIVAALQGYIGYSDLKFRIRNYFVDAYSTIFTPFLIGSTPHIQMKLIAIYGATDEIAMAAVQNNMDHEIAIELMKKMILAILNSD